TFLQMPVVDRPLPSGVRLSKAWSNNLPDGSIFFFQLFDSVAVAESHFLLQFHLGHRKPRGIAPMTLNRSPHARIHDLSGDRAIATGILIVFRLFLREGLLRKGEHECCEAD